MQLVHDISMFTHKKLRLLLFVTGNMYTIYTPDTYGYNYLWMDPSDEYFVFRVAACSDVHVALSNTATNSTAYEIILGGWTNTQSAIRLHYSSHLTEHSTPNILHCRRLRSFWMQWDNRHIRVGSGDKVKQDIFMEHHIREEDPQPPFVGVSLSTGYSYEGEWEYQDKYGNL